MPTTKKEGFAALIKAISDKNPEGVKECIDNLPNLGFSEKEIKDIIENRKLPFANREHSLTLLGFAIMQIFSTENYSPEKLEDSLRVIEVLLEKGAKPEFRIVNPDESKIPLLSFVIRYMEDLEAKQADARKTMPQDQKEKAIREHAESNLMIFVSLYGLLSKKSPNIASYKDEKDLTAYHVACALGNFRVVEFLRINNGSNNEYSKKGYLPQHLAMMRGHKDVADFLLKRQGVEFFKQSKLESPEDRDKLYKAYEDFLPSYVERSKSKGVKEEDLQQELNKLLFHANELEDKDHRLIIVRTLISKGATADFKDPKSKMSTLSKACSSPPFDEALIEVLLSSEKCDINSVDGNNFNALDWAKIMENQVACDILQKNGLQSNADDSQIEAFRKGIADKRPDKKKDSRAGVARVEGSAENDDDVVVVGEPKKQVAASAANIREVKKVGGGVVYVVDSDDEEASADADNTAPKKSDLDELRKKHSFIINAIFGDSRKEEKGAKGAGGNLRRLGNSEEDERKFFNNLEILRKDKKVSEGQLAKLLTKSFQGSLKICEELVKLPDKFLNLINTKDGIITFIFTTTEPGPGSTRKYNRVCSANERIERLQIIADFLEKAKDHPAYNIFVSDASNKDSSLRSFLTKKRLVEDNLTFGEARENKFANTELNKGLKAYLKNLLEPKDLPSVAAGAEMDTSADGVGSSHQVDLGSDNDNPPPLIPLETQEVGDQPLEPLTTQKVGDQPLEPLKKPEAVDKSPQFRGEKRRAEDEAEGQSPSKRPKPMGPASRPLSPRGDGRGNPSS